MFWQTNVHQTDGLWVFQTRNNLGNNQSMITYTVVFSKITALSQMKCATVQYTMIPGISRLQSARKNHYTSLKCGDITLLEFFNSHWKLTVESRCNVRHSIIQLLSINNENTASLNCLLFVSNTYTVLITIFQIHYDYLVVPKRQLDVAEALLFKVNV